MLIEPTLYCWDAVQYTPSMAPTVSNFPSIHCVDSSMRFKLTIDGKKINRFCSWVARRKTDERCAITGVSNTCALTCGTCSKCADSPLRLKFILDGTYIYIDLVHGLQEKIPRKDVLSVEYMMAVEQHVVLVPSLSPL